MLTIEDMQLKRGSTAENDAFVGLDGTISIDNEGNSIRVHDGKTPGGFMRIGVLDTLSDSKGEFLVADELKVAADGVTDYETTTVNLSIPARVRVYHNELKLNLDTEWVPIAYDEETLEGAFRVLVPMNSGDAIRIIQYVTVYDIIDEIFMDRADELRPDDYISLTERAQPNGVATLDTSGKVPITQLPTVNDLDYDIIHVYTSRDAIDLGDMDVVAENAGELDVNVPGDVLTIFDTIDFGDFGGTAVSTIETPRLVSPLDGATDVDVTSTFRVNGYFAQLADGNDDPQVAIYWSFYSDSSRSVLVYETGRVIDNLTEFTFNGTSAALAAGQTLFMRIIFESQSGQMATLEAAITLADN